ncbi:MAG: hypothetical protein J7641_01580 [Cyanobacteria bacterium SID2]|nr:hypothetical protein [Cyanobacteria bacterium SID2]MBP0004398.1 hypothetical protein [Cyanobacteria bacterium SBC]
MFVPTCSPDVRESAERVAQSAKLLLNTRSEILRGLLRCYWIWQVPGLGSWLVFLAVRLRKPLRCCQVCQYSDVIDLARMLLHDRASLESLASVRSDLHSVLVEIDRNAELRPAVVSYFADRLREQEEMRG